VGGKLSRSRSEGSREEREEGGRRERRRVRMCGRRVDSVERAEVV